MDWSRASVDEIDRGLDHFGGLRAASDAELRHLIQAADAAQSWMRDGARNLVEWVSLRLRVRSGTAARLVRVARRLVDLPLLSERFAAGELSLDQVDAISRVATPDIEEGLVAEALGLSNHELDRRARRANPPSADDEAEASRLRGLWIQRRLDEAGGRLTTELPNADLEIVETVLRKRADRYPVNPETGMFDPYSQRLADALVETFATTGDTTSSSSSSSSSVSASVSQVVLFTDLDALTTETEGVAELASGNLVANDTARWLSCDCLVERVVTDGAEVIGVGRRSRTVPGWLRRLVHHRDGGRCQLPGCGESRWLQIHHIIHWSLGGTTDLENLILLCGYHHRFLHEKGWHITKSADGDFEFRRPDWRLYPQPREPLHPRLANLVGRSP